MKQKKAYLEALRIISVYFVIYTHIPAVYNFTVSSGIERFIGLVLTVISKISVPIFFMISGAVLLDKEESYRQIIKKRFMRICLVIFMFSLGLFILNNLRLIIKGQELVNNPVKVFIKQVLDGTVEYAGSYWFLYIYLAMILSLPFMRLIALRIQKVDYIAMLIMHFCFYSFLPLTNIVLEAVGFGSIGYNSGFDAPFANKMIFFYPFIGYYLDKKINIKRLNGVEGKRSAFTGAIALFVSIMCTYYEAYMNGNFLMTYNELFNYVFAILVFVYIKYLYEVKLPEKTNCEKINNMTILIGSSTFGIYLLDPYLGLTITGKYHALLSNISTLIAGLIWCAISMTICGIISLLLKKLPIIKKLL